MNKVTYKLYRSTTLPVNTSGAAVCTNPASNTCFDNALTASTTYYYALAVDNVTNIISTSVNPAFLVVTLPNVPSAPTATAIDGRVDITWPIPAAGGSDLP